MNSFGNELQTSWDWRAAGNFMFGGAGAALVLMAAAASYPNSPHWLVGLSSLALIGLGLLLVWLEIGRPWRALHVFFHPQTSWMTREGSVGTVLFPLALMGIFMKIPALIALAGLLGLAYLYCQGRILKATRGIPAWREPGIVPLIIATGLCEGTGLLILMLAALKQQQQWLLFILPAFIAFRAASWLTYKTKLAASKAPPKTLAILDGIHPLTLWGGNVVPFVLLIAASLLPGATSLLAGIAAALAVLSGWWMKFTIVARAAQVQGYAVGKLQKGRPNIKPPVRRQKDKFVFDREYKRLAQD